MKENQKQSGGADRLPLVGPGDQNLIGKETLAAGSLRSRPPGSFFDEKMLPHFGAGAARRHAVRTSVCRAAQNHYPHPQPQQFVERRGQRPQAEEL